MVWYIGSRLAGVYVSLSFQLLPISSSTDSNFWKLASFLTDDQPFLNRSSEAENLRCLRANGWPPESAYAVHILDKGTLSRSRLRIVSPGDARRVETSDSIPAGKANWPTSTREVRLRN